MNRLIIIGAGGHGKVIADNAVKNGYTDICFVDDNMTGECLGFPIVGKCCDLENLSNDKTYFVIGIGNNEVRKQIAQKFDINWATIVHPSAQIATNVSVGKGSVVMAGAVINADASVGEHCIINTGVIIEHDNVIEDYVHISPNAALGGTVRIGTGTHIGIGATVINNTHVCCNCTVGAGAVVVRDIKTSGTYVGVPAEEIKRNS